MADYAGQGTIPRRFESVFTGVRPWCLTVVSTPSKREKLFIHSYDKDGVTRLYRMDESSSFDVDEFGQIKEIEGFVETKAYTLKSPLLLKNSTRRFYRLNYTERSISIKLFSRPEVTGEWIEFWDTKHLINRNIIEDGVFRPVSHKGQTRSFVNLPSEKKSPCNNWGDKFIAIQYRLEFKGPLNLDSFVVVGSVIDYDKTVSSHETEAETLIYDYRPDYNYSIANI